MFGNCMLMLFEVPIYNILLSVGNLENMIIQLREENDGRIIVKASSGMIFLIYAWKSTTFRTLNTYNEKQKKLELHILYIWLYPPGELSISTSMVHKELKT